MRIAVLLLVGVSAAWGDTSRREVAFTPRNVGLQRSIPIKSTGLYGTAVSPDSRWLAVAGADGVVHIFSTVTWKEEKAFAKHGDFAWAVAFSPDGRFVAAGGGDGVVRVYETKTWTECKALTGHTAAVYGLAWTRDSKRLASGSADQTARVWDVESGKDLKTLGGHTNYVAGVAWSPDGKRLATTSYDTTVRLWDVDAAREEKSMQLGVDGNALLAIAWSRNGRHIAVGTAGGTVHVCDADLGRQVWTTTVGTAGVYAAEFSPDGRHLVAAGGRLVKIYEAADGKELAELKHHSGDVYGIAIAPGARWIATAAHDFQVKIWGPRPGGMAGIRAKGFFGVSVQTSGDGVAVSQVIPDTAAQRAGMQEGDVITAVNGVAVATMEEAIGQIGSYFVGDEVEFTIKRAGAEMKLKAKLGERPQGQ